MTRIVRWTLTVGLLSGSCLIGMANADSSKQGLLKLLELQTLNRTAPHGAATKKQQPSPEGTREDSGAGREGSQPQQNDRGANGSARTRQP